MEAGAAAGSGRLKRLTFLTHPMWHLLVTHLCRGTKKVSHVFLEFNFIPVKEDLLQNSIIFVGENCLGPERLCAAFTVGK